MAAKSVEKFEKLEQIGEGTYGQVWKARDKTTNEIVALKKVRMDNEREGFPITAIREIKILRALTHHHVVKMKEIVVSKAHQANQNKGSIYLVFEYLDHDLTGLAERPGVKFTLGQIKLYMSQCGRSRLWGDAACNLTLPRRLLKGLHYCHKNNILHRDIKGSNILISKTHDIKIADFGLARSFQTDSSSALTNRVITLWYRPPELLLGATKYGPEIDLWSVGCILAELLTGKPLLPGKNEAEQMDLIFRMCGTPTEETWPGVSKLQWYTTFCRPGERPHRRRLAEHLAKVSPDARDLCEKLLTMDPAKRMSARDALLHDYFSEATLPKRARPEELGTYEESHEYTTKKRRQEARAAQEGAAAGAKAGGAQPHPGPLQPGIRGVSRAAPVEAALAAASGVGSVGAGVGGTYGPGGHVPPYAPGYAPGYAHPARPPPAQPLPPPGGYYPQPYGAPPPGRPLLPPPPHAPHGGYHAAPPRPSEAAAAAAREAAARAQQRPLPPGGRSGR